MAHYIISYDLHKDRNYEPVWALLQSWGCVRLLESVWLGSLTGGAGAIRKAVSDAMDADDSVAVIELKPGSEWAALRARELGTDWLTQNIQSYR
ncbi:MAG TPA: hypothetical protein VKB16_05910 [Beijerinckiaceae bacterium]|jgi:CRISPR/Cas system-associated endoribonuclease Cas2|nr:hypothetical protein [Beijerinckiaceae bacterium]